MEEEMVSITVRGEFMKVRGRPKTSLLAAVTIAEKKKEKEKRKAVYNIM